MSTRYQFGIASTEDDAQLRACMAKNHMGEDISISFRREPSYFDACKIQGDNYQIIKCVDSKEDRIVGLGSRFILTANINGHARHVGYLADLRGEAGVRNGTLLARGYKYLHELHHQQPIDYYYSLVLSNNTYALKQLTSQRAGLPTYHSLGKILSPALHLDLPKAELKINGLEFSMATQAKLPEIFAFIQKQQSKKQFSPVYKLSDFGSGRLRGLSLEDIYVAYYRNNIVATIAAWDQYEFRQTHIEAYSNTMRLVKPFYNSMAKLTPLKPLPNKGDRVPHLYFSMVAVENNDCDIFSALLRHVYRARRTGSWHYAIIGLHEKDPLAECLQDYRSIAASGELFSVCFPNSHNKIQTLDQRIPYIELACA